MVWATVKWLLFFLLGAFAANFVWGWAMERLGLAFIPEADALIRISVVFLFLELLVWWKPGQKTMSRILRHIKQWINNLRRVHERAVTNTTRQIRLFQILTTIIILTLCYSQYGFLVNSATERHTALSPNIRIVGMHYQNGLLIEFGSRHNYIDPVNIQLSIINTDNRCAIWWDSPHLTEQSPLFVNFPNSPTLIACRADFNPPNFTLYALGSPLSSTNSLYVFFGGSPVIESCNFNGEYFIRQDNRLIWDKR